MFKTLFLAVAVTAVQLEKAPTAESVVESAFGSYAWVDPDVSRPAYTTRSIIRDAYGPYTNPNIDLNTHVQARPPFNKW